MTFAEIGQLVMSHIGRSECLARYKTDDPEWVGALAIRHGHVTHTGDIK